MPPKRFRQAGKDDEEGPTTVDCDGDGTNLYSDMPELEGPSTGLHQKEEQKQEEGGGQEQPSPTKKRATDSSSPSLLPTPPLPNDDIPDPITRTFDLIEAMAKEQSSKMTQAVLTPPYEAWEEASRKMTMSEVAHLLQKINNVKQQLDIETERQAHPPAGGLDAFLEGWSDRMDAIQQGINEINTMIATSAQDAEEKKADPAKDEEGMAPALMEVDQDQDAPKTRGTHGDFEDHRSEFTYVEASPSTALKESIPRTMTRALGGNLYRISEKTTETMQLLIWHTSGDDVIKWAQYTGDRAVIEWNYDSQIISISIHSQDDDCTDGSEITGLTDTCLVSILKAGTKPCETGSSRSPSY